MKKRVGFTLIELLVVIAIIALLLAILMPSLAKVKEIASAVVCMNNQKQLTLAFRIAVEDNDGKTINTVFGGKDGWVERPQATNGTGVDADDATLEDRINGIRAGALFDYVGDYKPYHCTGDKRWLKGTCWGDGPRQKVYVSYALPDSIGTDISTGNGQNTKASFTYAKLKSPSTSYLFLEDGYDGFVKYNNGWTFDFDLSLGNPNSWWWNDPMGTYHTEGCTFSYADGHVEKYKWRDPRSPEFFNDRKNNQESQPGNEDIRFMLSNSPRVG